MVVFEGTFESNNVALYEHVPLRSSSSSLQYWFYVPHHVPLTYFVL